VRPSYCRSLSRWCAPRYCTSYSRGTRAQAGTQKAPRRPVGCIGPRKAFCFALHSVWYQSARSTCQPDENVFVCLYLLWLWLCLLGWVFPATRAGFGGSMGLWHDAHLYVRLPITGMSVCATWVVSINCATESTHSRNG